MAERALEDIGPSLIDVKATGGIHAGEGFTVKERYLVLLISEWLALRAAAYVGFG